MHRIYRRDLFDVGEEARAEGVDVRERSLKKKK